jgi:hypothetical protein
VKKLAADEFVSKALEAAKEASRKVEDVKELRERKKYKEGPCGLLAKCTVQ